MQGGNAANIKKQVRLQFQSNANETDPAKVLQGESVDIRQFRLGLVMFVCLLAKTAVQIAEQKDAAIRGLSNYMFMEAQRMAVVSAVRYRDLCPLTLSPCSCTRLNYRKVSAAMRQIKSMAEG